MKALKEGHKDPDKKYHMDYGLWFPDKKLPIIDIKETCKLLSEFYLENYFDSTKFVIKPSYYTLMFFLKFFGN